MNDVSPLINQLYKTESARLLAVLTRLFGTHNLDLVEDVLHDAFNKALKHWQEKGVPEKPAAWITQTAKNQAIDVIRAHKTSTKFSSDLSQLLESEWSLGYTIEQEFSESHIKDDQLRMIFMCCHDSIKPENRIPFILKTLCGFSLTAIARALVLPEATIKKRLFRTREKLKTHRFALPEPDQLMQTMDTVHTVLYLLFNEGFYSSDNKKVINTVFCYEAIGLVNLVREEPNVVNQDTLSLLALMHFHIARIDARLDEAGHSVPMDLQDRSLWKQASIETAERMLHLADAAPVGASGRFFVEALIAREHCRAHHFEQTNWPVIVECYTTLIELTGSPIAQLNQAIAIAYAGEVDKALAQVITLASHKALKKSHMPSAILAHLYAKKGDKALAYKEAEKAQALGGTPHEHRLMLAQIQRLCG